MIPIYMIFWKRHNCRINSKDCKQNKNSVYKEFRTEKKRFITKRHKDIWGE